MTKRKADGFLASIKVYTYLCKKKMPTLLIAFGIRFFYMDEHEPIHVHISYGGRKAKIELSPTVRVIYRPVLKIRSRRILPAIETQNIS